MGFLKDFKAFALKGNVVDMAVGVIIGGAFGKIVTSLVNDIIMPPLGMLIGKVNFADLSVTLHEAVMEGDKVVTPAVTLKYGAFIQQVVDFAILAFCVFIMVKFMTRLTQKKEAEPAPAPAPAPEPEPEPEPTKEELLLTEIRDLLKEKK